jgi:D-arabinose 5-phosphate isomerase GutQ
MVATLIQLAHHQCFFTAEATHGDLGMMQKEDIIIASRKWK